MKKIILLLIGILLLSFLVIANFSIIPIKETKDFIVYNITDPLTNERVFIQFEPKNKKGYTSTQVKEVLISINQPSISITS